MAQATEIVHGKVIDCADCGFPHATTHKNTKYCHVCRYFKSTRYVGTKKTKCVICDKKFCAVERGEMICDGCSVLSSKHQVTGRCQFCETDEATLLNGQVLICQACSHSLTQRPKMLKALAIKREGRIKSTPTKEDYEQAAEDLERIQPDWILARRAKAETLPDDVELEEPTI